GRPPRPRPRVPAGAGDQRARPLALPPRGLHQGLALPLLAAGAMIGPDVRVDPDAWIHPTAQLYGDVEIADRASVWPNVVVRAESQRVRIGARSNIQDFVMIHVGAGTGTIVGEDCSITHHCTLHGCRIGDRVLVGIGSTVMDGCEIGDNSIIAGHAFLK